MSSRKKTKYRRTEGLAEAATPAKAADETKIAEASREADVKTVRAQEAVEEAIKEPDTEPVETIVRMPAEEPQADDVFDWEPADESPAPCAPGSEAETRGELASRIFSLLSFSNLEMTAAELAGLEALAANCGISWLSASVFALCAWFRDDPENSRSYIEKSLFLDSQSTSLLYMLLMRRIDRPEAAAAWLTRYLDYQEPNRIDARALRIVDALQEGLFGEYGGRHLQNKAAAWYEALLLEPGFLEKQRAEWVQFFASKTREIDDGEYPTLSSVVCNWKELKTARAWIPARKDIADYFGRIASNRPLTRAQLERDLNGMLIGLINGAENEPPVDLSESLIKSITEPGRKISNGARKMLLSMSKETLAEEYDRHDKKTVGVKPMATVSISGWFGSYDGVPESLAALRESLGAHLNRTRAARAAETRVSSFHWVVLITGIILLILGIPQFNPLFITISLIPIVYWVYVKIEVSKKAAEAEFEYSGAEAEALTVFDKFASEIAKLDAVYTDVEEE